MKVMQAHLRKLGLYGIAETLVAITTERDALKAEAKQWKELHRALLVEHLELKKKVRAATKPIDPPAFGSPNGA